MIKENLKLSGNVKIVLTDSNGNVKQKQEKNNLVVKSGRDFIASRMVNVNQSVMSHMAIGTGVGVASAGNVSLDTEVERVTLTDTEIGTGGDENVVTYTATFDPGEPGSDAAVTEAGIFNAASNGVMLCRTTFPVVNKSPDDTLSITWTITINAA